MRRPSRIPAVTTGESVWVAVVTGATIVVLGMVAAGPDLTSLFLRDVPPRGLPPHTALPDLCSVFPGGKAAGLTLKPDHASRELDRNKAGCAFQVTGRGTDRVRLEALRPEPLYGDQTASGVLKEAKEQFVQDPSRSTPETGAAALPGLGDEAKIFGTQDVTVVIRTGPLITRVRYQAHRTPLATAQENARRLAAELLKLLPPKGA